MCSQAPKPGLSALQVPLPFHFCSAFLCHPNILSWVIWARTCSQTQEGKPEGTVLSAGSHSCCPQLAITLEAAGLCPAGQELAVAHRDSHSWAKCLDNLVSNSVSHSRTATGCQSSSGIHLAALMPKTLKWWNNLPFLLSNCGSFLRKKHTGISKYQQQWLWNTLIADHCLRSFKDFFLICFFYSILKTP